MLLSTYGLIPNKDKDKISTLLYLFQTLKANVVCWK